MPRIGRKNLGTNVFHAIVQGLNKEYIFETDKLKQKYETLLFNGLSKYNVKLFSHCVMSNHAHMIIYAEKTEEMSKYMQSINVSFSRYYNKIKNRVGVVFRNRFDSEPILNEKYLLNCIAYVHLNPVKANMVKKPGDYKYSSYNNFINGTADSFTLNFIFGTSNDYLQTFYYIHNKPNNYEFKDFCEDTDYDSKIRKLLGANTSEIVINEQLLEKTVKNLIIVNKIPIIKVCDTFNLSRYKINKILAKV